MALSVPKYRPASEKKEEPAPLRCVRRRCARLLAGGRGIHFQQ